MTKRIALFVEGQTELYFALWAIRALATESKLHIQALRIGGGTHRVALYKMPVEEIGDAATAELHFLVVDCSSDERVVSYISEQHPHLMESGYHAVLGLRDLRPDFNIEELGDLQDGIRKSLSHLEPRPEISIAVQEVEAWFISENTHFVRLDPSLTPANILEHCGLDVTSSTESLDSPAEALHQIYSIAGIGYSKSKADVQRTVASLSFEEFGKLAPDTAPSGEAFLNQLRALV